MFSTLYGTYFLFQMHFKMSSAICFNLDLSKILSSCNWFNPFPNHDFKTVPKSKSLQTTILNLMEMAEISQNGLKTLWEKEKLLVTSNFSFSHSVFKRLVLQTRKNQGLFGKGLRYFADDNVNVSKMIDSVIHRVENIVGK